MSFRSTNVVYHRSKVVYQWRRGGGSGPRPFSAQGPSTDTVEEGGGSGQMPPLCPPPPPRLFQLTSINGLTHQGTYEVQIQMEYLQKREPLPSVLAASALVCTLKDLQSTFLSEQYSNCLKLLKSARIIRNCISPESNKRDKTVISFELSLTRQGFRLLHFLNNRGSTCVYSHTTHTG